MTTASSLPPELESRFAGATERLNVCLSTQPDLLLGLLAELANSSGSEYFEQNLTVVEQFMKSECQFSWETFWPMHIRIIMTIVFATLSIVGIVGNLMVITVVLRIRGMITPTNCYLVSLAASDCLFFLATAPVELSYFYLPTNYYAFGQFGCAILSFLPYLAINASSLSITAFTIERYIGICHPMRARYMCTVKRARIIIACIWTFCVLYNSPWLYLATLKPISFADMQAEGCSFKLERSNWTYKVMFLGDFAAFYLLPMLLYGVLYVRIALALKSNRLENKDNTTTTTHAQQSSPSRSRKLRNSLARALSLPRRYSVPSEMSRKGKVSFNNDDEIDDSVKEPKRSNTAHSSPTKQPSINNKTANRSKQRGGASTKSSNASCSGVCLLQLPQAGNLATNLITTLSTQDSHRETFITGGKKASNRHQQVVKMLAVVVAVFAILWLPYRAMVMYNSFASNRFDPDWYILLSKTMIFLNCAINPVLYNLMSARFRIAFRQLLRYGSKIPPYQNGTSTFVSRSVSTVATPTTRVKLSQESRNSAIVNNNYGVNNDNGKCSVQTRILVSEPAEDEEEMV